MARPNRRLNGLRLRGALLAISIMSFRPACGMELTCAPTRWTHSPSSPPARISAASNIKRLKWGFAKSVNLRRYHGKIGPFRTNLGLNIRNEGFVREDGFRAGEKDGVIIVDHGSRRRESNLMLDEFVVMFRAKTNYAIVEPAHMELAEPSIKDAFISCVQQGANRVIDIPSLVAEAAKEHSGVSYIVTAPLGLHELIVDVMNGRIKHCLSHVAGDVGECDVCAGTGKCCLH